MGATKKRAEYWNELDDALLAKLFKDGQLDATKRETADIRKAHSHWPKKNYNSFAKLYRRKAQKWVLEKTLSGVRRGPSTYHYLGYFALLCFILHV